VLVALATAMISKPDILVLDEWDSHLDAPSSAMLQNQLNASGVRTILQCTQNMDLAASADNIVFLKKGRVYSMGNPLEVFGKCKETCYYPPSWRWSEWNLRSKG